MTVGKKGAVKTAEKHVGTKHGDTKTVHVGSHIGGKHAHHPSKDPHAFLKDYELESRHDGHGHFVVQSIVIDGEDRKDYEHFPGDQPQVKRELMPFMPLFISNVVLTLIILLLIGILNFLCILFFADIKKVLVENSTLS